MIPVVSIAMIRVMTIMIAIVEFFIGFSPAHLLGGRFFVYFISASEAGRSFGSTLTFIL